MCARVSHSNTNHASLFLRAFDAEIEMKCIILQNMMMSYTYTQHTKRNRSHRSTFMHLSFENIFALHLNYD